MSLVVSDDQLFEEHLNNHPKIIVKYYADWCGSCKLLAPKYKRLASDNRFKEYTFLDINAENNPIARKTGNVKSLPTFAIFKNGKLEDSVCTSKEDGIIELLEKLN